MPQLSRERDRERLEHELQSKRYGELLRSLQDDHSIYRRFHSWADVLALMHSGTAADAETDRVLRPILQAMAVDADARWRSVLLAIFWPGLESIFWQKRHWDRDPDRHWQNVTWAFLQTVCRLDVDRRPSRLAAKVINDTVNRLYGDYRREWQQNERERPTEQEELVVLVGEGEDLGVAAVDLFDSVRARLGRLREHVAGGRISETDYLMLVATRVYGETLAEWSRKHDVDYEVARKRRQRAEARIRRVDGEPEDFGI